ncbi:hypothetical protein BD626DRAFT_496353 [Schizophyllum amplum]|uniref:FAD-binding PCMH-type domain-containing protein n=1 Tax=Schizophyllum amplum TaxID=97359 RepID=A0A550CEV4_9AGAR|nr:hypothetical protein BD626DRAFT_496353 [Auriculariopsis ampla]
MRSFLSLTALTSLALHVLAQDVDQLKADLGDVQAVFPGDGDYTTAAQPFNLRFTGIAPIAVTYPTDAAQVGTAILAGSKQNLQVVARGGGHSYIANGLGGKDGALVVDMSKMKDIQVNEDGSATIQTGNRLGDVVRVLSENGRAMPHGTCPFVGAGGHMSFGGYGFTSRQWGLAMDTIYSADVVLANGTAVTASETENADLLWALKGAAPSFGIVTAWHSHTFEQPQNATVFTDTYDLTVEEAVSMVDAFTAFTFSGLPPSFGSELTITKGSEKGKVTIAHVGAIYANVESVNETLSGFTDNVPEPVSISRSPGSYVDSVLNLGGVDSLDVSKPDSNDTFYTKSLVIPEAEPMTDEALTAWFDYNANEGFDSDLQWFLQIQMYGGNGSVINQVDTDATAYAHRSSLYTYQLYASSPNLLPPFPDNGYTFLDDMVDIITSSMPSDWEYGAYLNYVEERLENWQDLYYDSHYQKLQTIKAAYDPNNVFYFPTSIEVPSA